MDIRSVGNTTQTVPAFVDKKVADPAASVNSDAQPILDAAVPAVAEAQAAAPAPTLDQVTQAINSLNKAMSEMSPDLQFSIDEDNRTIIKIVDQKTKEVLRQIPSVEALAIAKAIDQAQGLLIKQKA
jgi:flagellar protein FlaG